MGIVDDDGIGIRNIHTAFDDIGTDEHIIFLRHEIEYGFFQRIAFKFAMRHADTDVRT